MIIVPAVVVDKLSYRGPVGPLAGVRVVLVNTVIPRLSCLWLECVAGSAAAARVIWSED